MVELTWYSVTTQVITFHALSAMLIYGLWSLWNKRFHTLSIASTAMSLFFIVGSVWPLERPEGETALMQGIALGNLLAFTLTFAFYRLLKNESDAFGMTGILVACAGGVIISRMG